MLFIEYNIHFALQIIVYCGMFTIVLLFAHMSLQESNQKPLIHVCSAHCIMNLHCHYANHTISLLTYPIYEIEHYLNFAHVLQCGP